MKLTLYKKAIGGDVMAQIMFLSLYRPQHWKCSPALWQELKEINKIEEERKKTNDRQRTNNK